MRPINKTGLCEGCGVAITAKDKRTRFCSIGCAHSGERSRHWKGDSVGIDALHTYIRKKLPKPDKCEHCKVVPPYDLANKSNNYKRDVSDWEWLCRKCHMASDGRLEIFISSSNMHNKVPDKNCLQCGKSFTPKSNARKFCSKPCSTRYYNLNTREYKRNDTATSF